MTTAAIPRPRLRIKRPKPPSRRLAFRLLVLAICLAGVAGDAPIAPHDFVVAVICLCWAGQFCLQCSIYKSERRIEESHDGAGLPPIDRAWLYTFVFWAGSQAVLWLALL